MEEEREQEDHLLYVALTRTLADGAEGSGILYLVCRGSDSLTDDDDDHDKAHERRFQVKWPDWLPKKYRSLWKWDTSNQPEPDEVATELCLDTPEMETLEMCLDTTLVPDTFLLGSQQQKSIVINVPQVKPYERVVSCPKLGLQTITSGRHIPF